MEGQDDLRKKQKFDVARPPKKVLLFGENMLLMAIVKSVRAASDLLDNSSNSKTCSPANISFAANGKQMTANGYYVRYENEKVELEVSDIGKLSVPEYDNLCGEKRNYKATIAYRRKYKIKNKNV